MSSMSTIWLLVQVLERHGSPILNIKWHQTLNSQEAKIVSTDRHTVRVWDPNTEQARLQPFDILAHREKLKQEKIEAERAYRITIKRKLPKVNRLLAKRILENEETDAGLENDDDINMKKKSSKRNKGAITSEIFKDERFKGMFENKDFEIDEMSTEYQSLHPQTLKKQSSLGFPDYKRENLSCGDEAFHSICLRDWLHAITIRRQSDVLFRKYLYWSDPVSGWWQVKFLQTMR